MTILAKDRNHGRQYPLVVVQDVTVGQLSLTEAVPAIKLPAGARVIGGGVLVTTAFTSTTTDELDIGDAGDTDRYTSTEVDLHALGYTALTITGYKYTASDYLDLIWTVTDDDTPSTVGAFTIIVQYIIEGRANEVNPDYD
jgi:hypothetical protein